MPNIPTFTRLKPKSPLVEQPGYIETVGEKQGQVVPLGFHRDAVALGSPGMSISKVEVPHDTVTPATSQTGEKVRIVVKGTAIKSMITQKLENKGVTSFKGKIPTLPSDGNRREQGDGGHSNGADIIVEDVVQTVVSGTVECNGLSFDD